MKSACMITAAGITPAHAGKTSVGSGRRFRRRDHPRACGENGAERVALYGCKGSPPRMRGKRHSVKKPDHIGGITPAHAGKTVLQALRKQAGVDHPRACGENESGMRATGKTKGSPPRMRGKHKKVCRPRLVGGITPAHAGKTRAFILCSPCLWDHPRACGENLTRQYFNPSSAGSPPRMRGKLARLMGKSKAFGITPAHAGKTRLRA